jgi:hypothetical protein
MTQVKLDDFLLRKANTTSLINDHWRYFVKMTNGDKGY